MSYIQFLGVSGCSILFILQDDIYNNSLEMDFVVKTWKEGIDIINALVDIAMAQISHTTVMLFILWVLNLEIYQFKSEIKIL